MGITEKFLREMEEAKVKEKNKRDSLKKAQKKYDDAHYLSLQVHLDKDLVLMFKDVVSSLGLKQTDVIRYFISEFIYSPGEFMVGNRMRTTSTVARSRAERKAEIERREMEQYDIKLSSFQDSNSLLRYMSEPEINRKRQWLRLANYIGLELNNGHTPGQVLSAMFAFYEQKIKSKT